MKEDKEKLEKKRIEIIELDELYTYVKKKKINKGFTTAVDRNRGKIIDFEIGNGSSNTFLKLYKRIIKNYSVSLFCSDHNPVYSEIIT